MSEDLRAILMSMDAPAKSMSDVYYHEMRRIDNSDWLKFARCILKIPESEIDDIKHDHANDVREMKFQMLLFWGSHYGGAETPKDVLPTLVSHYLESKNTDSGGMTATDSEQHGKENHLVLVYDHKLEPQISKTKQKLERGDLIVDSFVCRNCKRYHADELNAAAASKYRIFILTGAFMQSSLDQFEGILEVGTPENTMMLTKTVKELPNHLHHLSLTTLNRLAADEIYEAIMAFISYRTTATTADDGDPSEESDDIQIEERHSDILTEMGFPHPGEKKLSNILVIGRICRRIPQLRYLAEIPWLKVFDFDPKGRTFGVLSQIENRLKSLRPLTTSDAKDSSVEPLNDCTTNWVFINGYCDSEFKNFVECPELDEMVISKHCDSIVNYCVARKVLRVVVIWEACNYEDRLDAFISNVKYHLKSQMGKFRCIICVPSKPNKHSDLGRMLKRLKLESCLCTVPVMSICGWIKAKKKCNCNSYESKTFPQFSSEGPCVISQKDYNWLSVCFDVVGSNQSDASEENLSMNGEKFLKGGKAEWQIIASMKYVADRDISPDPAKFVRKQFLETGKSGIVTIFHPPGGGGTTFSRRLLWELRNDAPCLELLLMDVSIEDVKNRLSFIRNETHLPAVVLVDGGSPLDVKTLLETCRYEKVVILHVQRFYSSAKKLPRKKTTDFIWVPENVSPKEANKLMTIFSGVRPQQKGALLKLTDEVNRSIDHCMFEYGLTAYDSEYHGVKSYVHGNLQISQSSVIENWHKVLTYLSLAQYYGHCALPSQLFSHLLDKNELDVVTLDDLPHQARKFVIEDNGNWKISYFIVAKEILEQVLVKRQCPEYCNQGKGLTTEAREGLCNIVVDFITFVKKNVSSVHTKKIPQHIQDILTAILIKRNYKDAGENDEFGSKSKYSRIIDDVTDDESRKLILQTLVHEFSSNPEFHAHLGRFYGINRLFEDAEKCFQDAFRVRNEEKKKERRDVIHPKYSGDPILHRIHSMYAFYVNEQIRHDVSQNATFGGKKHIKSILEKAELAVTHFRLSKDYYQKGCNPTYVFIGEIKLRLKIAEYANKISDGNIAKLREEEVPFCSLGNFVFESFSFCDQLLVQCMQYAEEYKIPQDELDTCINNFNAFFKSSEMALRHWMGRDRTLYSKKCHIAVLKIEMTKKKQNSHKFFMYEDVKNLNYLHQLIKLYEGILENARKTELRHHYISNYMVEWLQAIRHPLLVGNQDKYQLKQVHSRVEEWDQKNEHGSLSTFYHYVLTTLLAINGVRGKVTNAYSELSCKLKDKISDVMVPLPLMERTAEWLAVAENSQSIQNLIHRNLMGDWDCDNKFFKRENASKLKVCKGKITTCHIWYGHIVLDGGHHPDITVYFNPQRYGFGASDSKQKLRVEFYLGFNPKHGAEAFQVKILRKYKCSNCKTPTEVPKLGRAESKWSAECPKCEKSVDARSGEEAMKDDR